MNTTDNIIPFPTRPEPAADRPFIDLRSVTGEMIGVDLTEFDEVSIALQHGDDVVNGLISLPQALQLRDALTGMVESVYGPCKPGAA